MTKFTQIGLAAVLLLGVSAPAFALDATTAAGAAVGATAGAVVDPTETGSIADVNTLTTRLQSDTAVDLSAFNDQSTVKFVTLSSLQGDATGLDKALTDKADVVAGLHSTIGANAALKAKIEAGGYALDDVLAVDAGANGEFTIYIDDRA